MRFLPILLFLGVLWPASALQYELAVVSLPDLTMITLKAHRVDPDPGKRRLSRRCTEQEALRSPTPPAPRRR
jgi:hypothetical protein